jgi:hypothetical protein
MDIFRSIPEPLRDRTVVLSNPRNGKGCGWGAGLAAGILCGLKWCARNESIGFILKLDTDTLVIAPFQELVSRRFAQKKNTGLLGTYSKTPNRSLNQEEDFPKAPALRKESRQNKLPKLGLSRISC